MSKLPHKKLASALALTASVATMAGCPSPEPEEKLDGFVKETKEERDEAQATKMCPSMAVADITGTHLFAISAVISPTTPLQFIATVQATTTSDGGTMTIDFQPLALDVGSTTTPRTPVGEPLRLPATPIDADGCFAVDLGETMVTGMANPITGADIVATLAIEGGTVSEDLWCGNVTGMVSMPLMLDLAGSTFAATRITGTDPASLPTEVVYSCPMMPGDEGGMMESGMESGGATGTGG
jgi:hypothetical protein